MIIQVLRSLRFSANLSLENIQITGESYNAAISGYDYTGSTFSKIQIRKAQITGAKNYNAAFVGRASGSDIRDIAVIESKVVLSGTDCGGFIGEGKNLNIHHVYSDSIMYTVILTFMWKLIQIIRVEPTAPVLLVTWQERVRYSMYLQREQSRTRLKQSFIISG